MKRANGRGRPRAKVDVAEVEKLGMIQTTQIEMAAWFGISLATIERVLATPKYREAYERGKAKGRVSVRRHQMRLLEEGNATMGIWLGKQLLGQRDVTAMEVSGSDGGPVQVEMFESPAARIASRLDIIAARHAQAAAGGSDGPGGDGTAV